MVNMSTYCALQYRDFALDKVIADAIERLYQLSHILSNHENVIK